MWSGGGRWRALTKGGRLIPGTRQEAAQPAESAATRNSSELRRSAGTPGARGWGMQQGAAAWGSLVHKLEDEGADGGVQLAHVLHELKVSDARHQLQATGTTRTSRGLFRCRHDAAALPSRGLARSWLARPPAAACPAPALQHHTPRQAPGRWAHLQEAGVVSVRQLGRENHLAAAGGGGLGGYCKQAAGGGAGWGTRGVCRLWGLRQLAMCSAGMSMRSQGVPQQEQRAQMQHHAPCTGHPRIPGAGPYPPTSCPGRCPCPPASCRPPAP